MKAIKELNILENLHVVVLRIRIHQIADGCKPKDSAKLILALVLSFFQWVCSKVLRGD